MKSRLDRLIPPSALAFFALALWLPAASGQALPVELRTNDTPANFSSRAGMPLSNVVGDPPGSNGNLDTPAQMGDRGLTGNLPTRGQFQGMFSVGGGVNARPVLTTTATFTTYSAYAREVLPRTQGGPREVFLARAVIGAPIIGRRVEFLFGSQIGVPNIDANGDLLSEQVPAVLPDDYWLREPFWPAGQIQNGVHIGAPYYWSPHARAVFTNRPGPINITWRRTVPLANADPNAYLGNPDYAVIDGRVYALMTLTYLVSGSPSQQPKRMYWTEGSFRNSGVAVNVPEGVTVNFIFSEAFPKNVEEAYEDPGSSPPVAPGEGEIFTERRTIFYDPDRGSIRAFNWQGRIFLELLGDVLDGDRRMHLGTEIIDVVRRVNPADISVELGERLTAWQDGTPSDDHLLPQSLLRPGDTQFGYQHFQDGQRVQFYAIRETRNINDFLLHWTEEGVEGLRWPNRFVRYTMVWPSDIAKFSHYMRPKVANDAEARETAVEMPLSNVPIIEYEDPLDQPRAKLTETFAFYTYLTEDYPAHRTLLRFVSGDHVAFERVFSWLADDLSVDGSGHLRAHNRLAQVLGTPALPGAEEEPPKMLSAWDPANGRFDLEDVNPHRAPRVVDRFATVGARISAPADELPPQPGEPYWAGHIRLEKGTAYNPFTYQDPLAGGFDEANQGAIIPVNVIPDNDRLEVWWFRSNDPNLQEGFARIFWPSVVGRYTLQWPTSPEEIVLASNDGSGGLPSLQATGHIYVQNDPAAHGYNPNEEHALMLGGQAYALRDDLNITSGPQYSSEPYVLLQYSDADLRPSMAVFKVMREKPEEGLVFDYLVEAGTILQAPMPLPLMVPPVDGVGAAAVNFNTEPRTVEGDGDLPGNWDEGTHGEGIWSNYPRFTFLDRKDAFWVYRGLHAGPPMLAAGTYNPAEDTFDPPMAALAVAGEAFTYVLHTSQQTPALRLQIGGTEDDRPAWLTPNGIALEGAPPADAPAASYEIPLILSSIQDNSRIEFTLNLEVAEAASGATVATQDRLMILSTNAISGTQVLHVGRPPYLAVDPTPANSFTMRFYYKTQAGFAWPGMSAPPVGTIVPYLRTRSGDGFVGDAADKEAPSLDIVYRPVWPVDTPGIRLGDTLMTAKEGLPDIVNQSSARILYQQSVAADMTVLSASVVLHDPTREREISIAAVGLEALPSGVRQETFQGRVFFPNLPPHLVERVFFDPFRGTNGHLVLAGKLQEEVLGADYLLLNVLRGKDLEAVEDLCPPGDPDKNNWDAAVNGLLAIVETFHENPNVPGDYIPNPDRTVNVGIGDMVEINDHDTAVDSYALSATGPGVGYVTVMTGGGAAFSPSAEPVDMHIIRVEPVQFPGELKVIAASNPLSEQLTMQHSADLAGRFDEYEYDWRIAAPVDGFPPLLNEASTAQWIPVEFGEGKPRYTLGGANIRTLSDNYLIVRYRPINPAHPLYVEDPAALDNPDDAWSAWTQPMLAEGWIKRVLAGINPFNQRITDLFNNAVSTDVSLLTQAGGRWEGDIALNLENINNFGLIEIYETVLRRGRMLSIDAGINYGPANDALLLAAGYLHDLYMFVGNEAWADAANPTIGIGTADQTYGDIATSLFSFRGQVPSLLEEELALLRGRDDVFLPGTRVTPVYNRLIWNYTRGIDAGEVIYALNYNIQEKQDGDPTGTIDASDAARMYPQGHGDAYGHYLTALKGYYSLLMNNNFDWVPRIEAVLILGQPVSVDYFDERKFASAAAAVARSGQQVFDLTWRRDYRSNPADGWSHFAAKRLNERTGVTRYWGLDHWGTRSGQGTYINWLVGNALIPAEDPDPNHEGIQRIDRTTVTELAELTTLIDALQTNMSNAEAGLTPLGLPEGGIAFDIDPSAVADGKTHFEQIYERALKAMHNAVASFDDAKDVTRLMRSEEDSLVNLQSRISSQEQAFRNALIEMYGTPYPEDIGPGRTYAAGYVGPDLLHFMYVDLPELPGGIGLSQTNEKRTYRLDLQTLPSDWRNTLYQDLDFYQRHGNDYTSGTHFIDYELGPHGFFGKPAAWVGKRRAPGKLQQAISELIAAHHSLQQSLSSAQGAQLGLEKKVAVFNARVATDDKVTEIERGLRTAADIVKSVNLVSNIVHDILDAASKAASDASAAAREGIPKSFIAGLAAGGDVASAARLAIALGSTVAEGTINAKKLASKAIVQSLTLAEGIAAGWVRFEAIDNGLKGDQQLVEQVAGIEADIRALSGHLRTINERLRSLDDAERNYRALVAEGDRIREDRAIFRREMASIVQGYRTRDAAFRIFRNEKLERYKTLFELAARYSFLTAQAFDYETGLLGTEQGEEFIGRIVSSRALGVMSNGEPQFAGSNTGDPGLSSVLAEMYADWSVLRGRLGFNNPDTYGTTFSLRSELFRVLSGQAGDQNWQDILQSFWSEDILSDADVRRHAMQADHEGFPVPGLIIPFRTTIATGRNFFGHPLMPGDSNFSPTSFATKIFSAGIALPGYTGMTDPSTNLSDIHHAEGSSPSDPSTPWLHPDGLAATPYIYLIPTGVDSMRSPPLGDTSAVRTWLVRDVTVPLPFNVGGSQFSTLNWWQSSEFLTEEMFSIRKHQSFRPVSDASVFGYDLSPSQFTNSRLIGRSVWNSEWKIVIPGNVLLSDGDEGLRRFIRTVEDIQLHLTTYSYSGN